MSKIEKLVTNLIANNFSNSVDGQNYAVDDAQIRISHIVGPCTRKILLDRDLVRDSKLFLKNIEIVEEKPVSKLNILDIGNMYHEYIQKSLIDQTEFIAKERKVRFKFLNFELTGHFDLLLNIDNELIIVDIKTTKMLDYQLKHKYVPKPEHIEQIELYMKAMNLNAGAIIYVDKSTGDLQTFMHTSDSSILENTIAKLRAISDAENMQKLPAYKKIWLCRYCKYADKCEEIE